MEKHDPIILAIESSCDDTSAALLRGCQLLANVINTQEVHRQYGGVVPELASRAHLSNIVPVVHAALKQANLTVEDIECVAFTRGPGLLGALLVGTCFAKGFALARRIPMVEVNHLEGHILAPFIQTEAHEPTPPFPYLSLLVSGGHTQIVEVAGPREFCVLSHTIDDAAGEAFDKCAKMIGLPYPGGPHVDRLAQQGNPKAFELAHPLLHEPNFSFSGLKTSFLYLLRDALATNPHFIAERQADLCASLQATIIDILLAKVKRWLNATGIKHLAIGGGVAANEGLRRAVEQLGNERHIATYIPARRFTTDNAAMIGIAGLFKYRSGEFAQQDIVASPRLKV